MTAGELLRLLDAYVNRIDPDYVDHRYDFLNAGHRWVEQKFHFREAQYQKWQMTESLPAGVAVLALPACYRHSAEIRVTLLPDRTALARVKPADLRVGSVGRSDGVEHDFRSTPHAGDADALRHHRAVHRVAPRARCRYRGRDQRHRLGGSDDDVKPTRRC